MGGFNGAPASDTVFQLRLLARGWRLLLVRTAGMLVMRRTGERERGIRCRDMGVADGYLCASPLYALLRSARLAAGFQGPRCAAQYLAAYLQGSRATDPSLCPARRLVEGHRLRRVVSRILPGARG